MITGGQMRAARALLRWSADDLAAKSKLGVATVRRAEAVDGPPPITEANADALMRALQTAGIEFIPGNGRGPGVRIAKGSDAKTIAAEDLNSSNDK